MRAATCLGQAQCAFDDAAAYAAQRVQFGQPIGNFQLTQLKLTDMAIKLENMRNFVYKTAWMLDRGLPLKSQGALCKRYCAMSGFEVADDALQIFGGVGVGFINMLIFVIVGTVAAYGFRLTRKLEEIGR